MRGSPPLGASPLAVCEEPVRTAIRKCGRGTGKVRINTPAQITKQPHPSPSHFLWTVAYKNVNSGHPQNSPVNNPAHQNQPVRRFRPQPFVWTPLLANVVLAPSGAPPGVEAPFPPALSPSQALLSVAPTLPSDSTLHAPALSTVVPSPVQDITGKPHPNILRII